jgi:hypothetical protein
MTRQPYAGLTPEEIDAIAERAAEKALEHVYAQVGKSVLRKAAWLAGIAIVSLLMWLGGKGVIST